jgi:hypothetical protein
MNTKFLIRFALVALIFTTIITACKKTYQDPPESANPTLVVTSTIKDLKARHKISGAFDMINDTTIISGVVIANDKSGNLYKEMYIRDETGAIAVELSGTLYTNFPVGKRVYIKCNGMCLSDYNNMIQLGVKAIINGSPSLESVPTPLIPNYVFGGSLGNFDFAKPKIVTQSDLTITGPTMQFPLLGDLIQLEGYEFQLSDTRKTYGDTSSYKKAGELYIKSCSGTSSLLVRTSGYADFAAKNPASGNGSIAAIYTVYGTTKQLIIRDTNDVKFSGARCFLFEEDFGSLVTSDNKKVFAFSGWKNIPELGTVKFKNAVFGASGKCVLANAFGSSSAVATSWLVSPEIILPAGLNPKLSFTTAFQYAIGPTTLKPYISTNYDGGLTPWSATWTELIPPTPIPANTATSNSNSFSAFVSSGNISLASYATGQKVYIAFKYEGGDPGKTTNIELDDIRISKN